MNSTGTASGNANSNAVALSPNGRYVLFGSIASDLVATPKGTTPTACGGGPCFDVFVRDLKLGTTTLVSVNSTGTASGNAVSAAVGLTPNGQYVLFNSSASDLVATPACGGGPCSDVFVRQLR